MIKNRTLFNGLSEGGKFEMPIADGPFWFLLWNVCRQIWY